MRAAQALGFKDSRIQGWIRQAVVCLPRADEPDARLSGVRGRKRTIYQFVSQPDGGPTDDRYGIRGAREGKPGSVGSLPAAMDRIGRVYIDVSWLLNEVARLVSRINHDPVGRATTTLPRASVPVSAGPAATVSSQMVDPLSTIWDS